MPRQKSLFAIVGAIGCAALVVCVGIAAFAGFVYYTNVSAMRPVDRIAFVDNQANIQITDPQGAHTTPITTDAADGTRIYMFPTWSPDSSRLAFVGLAGSDTDREGTLEVAPTAGGKPTSVFKSKTQLPFYVYWAPDNRRVGFLAQNDTNMVLMVSPADGSANAKQLGTGSSLFWSWSPDGATLLTHTGGSAADSKDANLALVGQNSQQSKKLPATVASFQAPQFAPDGSRMLYAASGDAGKDALFVAGANGANPQSLMSYDGSIAFEWSPDSKHIATMVTAADAQLPMFGPISVSDADGKNRVQVTSDNAVAFYWAPNSQTIAYLTIADVNNNSGSGCSNCSAPPSLSIPANQNAPVHLQWKLASLADKRVTTLVTFVPTDDFVALLPFFDQYARSTTFWSPDSKHFVYTQDEGNSTGSVWVIDLGTAKPRKIGDGTLAVWSWK